MTKLGQLCEIMMTILAVKHTKIACLVVFDQQNVSARVGMIMALRLGL